MDRLIVDSMGVGGANVDARKYPAAKPIINAIITPATATTLLTAYILLLILISKYSSGCRYKKIAPLRNL